jgi:hypothetical protein
LHLEETSKRTRKGKGAHEKPQRPALQAAKAPLQNEVGGAFDSNAGVIVGDFLRRLNIAQSEFEAGFTKPRLF